MNDGGPIFPCSDNYIEHGFVDSPGMSLLDWFAGMALQGLLAGRIEVGTLSVSERAFIIADAMIAERERRMAK